MNRAVVAFSVLAASACSSSSPVSHSVDASRPNDASLDVGRRDALAGDAHTKDAQTNDAPAESAVTLDAGSPGDAGGCHGVLGSANRPRKVVISHPFDDAQNAAADFEVYDLDETGNLSQPNVHFALGPTSAGTVAFTPDGAVGIVAEDDGSLGVFLFDASGDVHVVTPSQTGSYYATGVVMDPSGSRAYILDQQTSDNGGGIYTVSIACDGSIHDDGLLVSADLPAGILPVDSGDAILVAKSVRGTPAILDGGDDGDAAPVTVDGGPLPGNDAVLVSWPSATSVLGNADPFGDDLAIVSASTLTSDGKYALIADDNQFSGIPNRIGVVRVAPSSLGAAGVVPNVNDPQALVASPFDDTVLMASGMGNAMYVLSSPGDGGAAFGLRGQVTYAGPPPQLPGQAVMIGRGSLRGRVLLAENQAIRQAQFAEGGVVTDLGPTYAGDAGALTSIVGAIGVQP